MELHRTYFIGITYPSPLSLDTFDGKSSLVIGTITHNSNTSTITDYQTVSHHDKEKLLKDVQYILEAVQDKLLSEKLKLE